MVVLSYYSSTAINKGEVVFWIGKVEKQFEWFNRRYRIETNGHNKEYNAFGGNC
jgi:hypothetical protein